MPLVEAEVGAALSDLIEKSIGDLKSNLGWKNVTSEHGHWLIQSVFWIVSGKILQDKRVSAFEDLEFSNLEDLFSRVARHYGSRPLEIGTNAKQAALKSTAETIQQFANLELATTESLAYVYENSLISKETRSSLGTHSTPAFLVDYVVGNLAEWIAEIPENERSVFEPACGHAAFLVSAMRLLSDLLPAEKSIPSRRGPYLRRRLHGMDIDAFALELARLSLTLTDIPNPDGWDLRLSDAFVADDLCKIASQSTIVLANPPFENFSPAQKRAYGERGIALTHSNKATELLCRLLTQMPDRSVFGFVLPQSFLHSTDSANLREYLVRQCEIQEICLFPDKVFPFSDAESAVLLGRKIVSRSSRVSYRRIREKDIGVFRSTYETSRTESIPQSSFLQEEYSLRLPELQGVWISLADKPRLNEITTLGQGLSYHGKFLPPGRVTYSENEFEEGKLGYVRFDRNVQIHGFPPTHYMNLDPEVVGSARSGTLTGVPQVLLNYAPVSRGPWRIKAFIDRAGCAISSRFIAVRPQCVDYPLEAIWALLNSPVANAFAYCHMGKREILVGKLRQMPIPGSRPSPRLTTSAAAYLEAAVSGVADAELEALMREVDLAVLELYDLPSEWEFTLLELFAGHQRVGVPFSHERYYPEKFRIPIKLKDFTEMGRDWVRTNRERGLLIDKRIEGTITPTERARLDALQAYAEYYVHSQAPRPDSVLDEIEERISRGDGNGSEKR